MTESDSFHYETPLDDIDKAISMADAAFRLYRNISYQQKAVFLESIAELINIQRSPLCEIASKETALPRARLEAEITRTVNQLYSFSILIKEGSWVRAIIDKAEPNRAPMAKPDIRQMQQPIGAVAVFGASNFPFAYAVIGGDSVAALAAGCPVVYKTNPGHPKTSEMTAALVIQAAQTCGMPDGVFSIVYGAGHESGLQIVKHTLIKAVGFTGSLRGGRALYDAAAARPEPIPVYAEMGSVNPVFILPEILLKKGKEIARTLAVSNTSSAGQFCTNPGVIVAPESNHTVNYLKEFAKSIQQTPAADMLNPTIYESFRKGVEFMTAKDHVSLMAKGKDTKKGGAHAHMLHTKGIDFLNDKELWEENFGPSSVQVIADDVDQMFTIANALPGQITISVWGTENDLKEHRKLVDVLEGKAGRIIINGVPTGVEVTAAMNHGGPYPATTDAKFTSVGTQSIYRFTRPVCYQGYPSYLLPEELQDDNPRRIWRTVDNIFMKP